MHEGTVSKLRFYESFHRSVHKCVCIKLIKFISLTRTESLLLAFLQKEDRYSLKFRFLSISKSSNFRWITTFQNFFVHYMSPDILTFISKNEQVRLSWFNLMLLFSTIQWTERYHVLIFLLKHKKFCHLQNYTHR